MIKVSYMCGNVNERRKSAINSKYLIGANLFDYLFIFSMKICRLYEFIYKSVPHCLSCVCF